MTEDSGKSWVILAVSLVIVAAVFASFFFLGKGSAKLVYNGFEFVNAEGVWRTEWERDGQIYILDFRFNPWQVEDVPVEGNTDRRFQFETLYLTIDPSEQRTPETAYTALAAVDLSRKLTDPFERNVIAACTRNETAECASRPIATCENTNSSVIYLRQAGETKVLLEGNCAIIQGSGEEIVRAAEKAIFQWLGIMN